MRLKALFILIVISTALAEDYFPASVGLSWTYSNGETQIFTEAREFGGEQVLTLTRYFQGTPVSEDYLSFSPEGVHMHGTVAGGETLVYEPPLLIYPGDKLEPGRSWQSRARVADLEITLFSEILGIRGVQTPLGRFNALHLRQQTVTSTGGQTLLDLFFVPTVGIVRFVTQDGTVIDLIETSF